MHRLGAFLVFFRQSIRGYSIWVTAQFKNCVIFVMWNNTKFKICVILAHIKGKVGGKIVSCYVGSFRTVYQWLQSGWSRPLLRGLLSITQFDLSNLTKAKFESIFWCSKAVSSICLFYRVNDVDICITQLQLGLLLVLLYMFYKYHNTYGLSFSVSLWKHVGSWMRGSNRNSIGSARDQSRCHWLQCV